MKIKIWLPIVIFLFLGVGVVYAYSNDLLNFNIFLSEKERDAKELVQARNFFPNEIGNFRLSNGSDDVRLEKRCEKIENNPDTANLDLKGEACSKTIVGKYEGVSNLSVVYIHLTKFTKGVDIYRQLLERARRDKIGNYDVMRIEKHEIAWYPESVYDFVVIQQGEKAVNGATGISYNKIADGANPITQYFLTQFPPELQNQVK